LLQFNQQPAFFESRFVIARTHRPVQQQRDPLVAVDDQIMLRLLGGHHHDGRLLTAGRQRREQTPMPFRPAHAKVLKTPLKLMEFQTHDTHPLDNSTLHQIRSGIARLDRVVSPHPPWNQ
jgi:hypothetical protein